MSYNHLPIAASKELETLRNICRYNRVGSPTKRMWLWPGEEELIFFQEGDHEAYEEWEKRGQRLQSRGCKIMQRKGVRLDR